MTSLDDRDTCILVPSCDRYSDLWRPFLQCKSKYWPDCPYRTYIGSNEMEVVSSDATFIKVGPDRSYSDNLICMLAHLSEKWVIFWVDDRLISDVVNTRVVQELVNAAKSQGADYLKLLPEHPMAYSIREFSIGEVPKGTKYRVSLTVALWRKQHLLDLLVSGESAWDIERGGSARSDRMNARYMALAPMWKGAPPIPHAHLVAKGRLIRPSLSFIEREKLRNAFSHREIEPWKSTIYGWMYHRFFGVVRPIQSVLLTYR